MTRRRDQPPEHWTATRLRHVLRLNPSKSELSGLEPADEVSFLPMEAIGEQGAIDLSATRPVAEVQSGYSYFRDGDVVIAKITPCFENGKGALMRGLHRGAGFGTTELIVARPLRDRIAAEYLQWLFQSHEFRGFGEGAMYGAGGQKRVPDDFVRDFRIALPPLPEQAAIAAFLDRETAKIDALVAEKKRLIVLLKEKRQAVISHAVTKGLNPDAPMKDTGVGWPAEIPAHWEVLTLTRVVSQFVDYRGVTPTKLEDGIPLITATQIKNGRIDHSLDPVFISEEEFGERMTRGFPAKGDVLLTTEAPLGEVAMIEVEKVSPGQRMILMKVDRSKMINEFLFLHFRSDFGRNELFRRASGSTASGIRADRLRGTAVLVPPLDEQAQTAKHIEDRTLGFADLLAEVRSQLDLLLERRSALISAAVTGKIDVRCSARMGAEVA